MFTNLPLGLQLIITGTVTTLIIFGLCFIIWMVISRALSTLEKRNQLSRQILLPIRMILRYGIFFAGAVFAISAFGVSIGNFWTFLSTVLGLIAIGFVAVWSVLSNISATFIILGIKPFRVGDYVILQGEEAFGKVINLDFMFTTLQRENGDIFKIPNNHFFQKSFLRPADNGKSKEIQLQKELDSNKTVQDIDHSNANLEGIETAGTKSMPTKSA